MTSLLEHANRELQKSGEGEKACAAVRRMVEALQEHGGNVGELSRIVDMVARLAVRGPLAPLTRHPLEWDDVSAAFGGTPMWQSTRDPRAFSTDGGRTYGYEGDLGGVRYRSVMPPAWVQALCEKHPGLSYAEALEAVQAYFDVEMTDEDVLILDTAGSEASRAEYLRRRFPGEAILVARLLYEPPAGPAEDVVARLGLLQAA